MRWIFCFEQDAVVEILRRWKTLLRMTMGFVCGWLELHRRRLLDAAPGKLVKFLGGGRRRRGRATVTGKRGMMAEDLVGGGVWMWRPGLVLSK
jgi:hypothetical protein